MAILDNRYSQFVALAKILLPILGLGLLSSLFLLSNRSVEIGDLPYSEVELEEIVESQSILSPRYQTILKNGTAVDVQAVTARPLLSAPGRNYRALEVTGTLRSQSGTLIEFDTGTADIDQTSKMATARDGLRIVHSAGYTMTARGGTTRFDGTEAVSEGDVVVKGEDLTLTAGRAELRTNPDTGEQVITFSQGVRVLYSAP